MKLKIEHGIAIPTTTAKPVETMSGVLRKMKVGDSLRIPRSKYSSFSSLGAQIFGKGNYTMRTVGRKSARVWRTK